ncbi:hypothetical protein BDQ17DRAFT_114200 [Cyathus striatus]|nr:hypothetical protein BDQ17DRAFT_114200 [Cyathus striatus]
MSTSTNGIKQTERHKEFYIPGGDFHLIAGNTTHFLVHTYFFLRESEYFRELLHTPTGESRKASDPSSALSIDASADEFAMFLRVFYNPKYTYFDNMTTADWIVILNLAHKWRFSEVKALAIRELEKIEIDLVPRIALYNKNEVDARYILPLYTKLCARDKIPTEEEAEMLDRKTLTFVFRARERLRAPDVGAGGDGSDDLISPLPGGMGLDTVLGILRGMLKIETDPDDLIDLSKGAVNGQGAYLSFQIGYSTLKVF